MVLDTGFHSAGVTTDKIALSSHLLATSYQIRVTIPSGNPTSKTWLIRVAASIEDDEAEEREWDSIVSKPHVRQVLRRMAAEARRQYYAGETEEGGFAVE